MNISEMQYAVLASLASGRLHGYAIVQEVAQFLGKPSTPLTTVYSCIEVLRERGLLTDDGEELVKGRARRYFKLTENGLEELQNHASLQQSRASLVKRKLAEAAPQSGVVIA